MGILNTPGLPPHMYRNIQLLLEKCKEFTSDNTLRAVFVDSRLAPWRNMLPQASGVTERVQNSISVLFDRYHSDTQDNALVLLLRVLAEQTDPGDALQPQLTRAADELARSFISPEKASILELDVAPLKDWTQLEKYLPKDMYCEIQDVTSDKKTAEICNDHLYELLRTVMTYLPRHLAFASLQAPTAPQSKGEFVEGTLLFGDISGFTALSDALKEQIGRENAETVVEIINDYLDAILSILYQHKGFLIKFGGDAILCMFTGNDYGARHAISAAWKMKQALAEHLVSINQNQGMSRLSMDLAAHSALLFAAHIGNRERMEFVLTGEAVERVALAEFAAETGDFLISEETYAQVKENVEVEKLVGEDLYRVLDVYVQPETEGELLWDVIERQLLALRGDLWALVQRLDALTPYIPEGVLSQLIATPDLKQIEDQYRQVVIMFVNFVRMDNVIQMYHDNLARIVSEFNRYFQKMQEEVEYYGGVINKVDLSTEGDKLMVIFGAPVTHEKDSQRAALAALGMQKALKDDPLYLNNLISQRIGIHTGVVFAGNLGSPLCNRREYTVMGDDVNLAARLMSAAKPDQILISKAVWEQIQYHFNAQALDPVSVKGKKQPIDMYLLQKVCHLRGDEPSRVVNSKLVGREAELSKLKGIYHSLVTRQRKHMIAITGAAGIGKSRLVQEWHQWAGGQADSPSQWCNSRTQSFGKTANGIFIEFVEQVVKFTGDDTPTDRWRKLSAWIRDNLCESSTGQPELYFDKLAFLGYLLDLDLSMMPDLPNRLPQDPQSLQLQMRLVVKDLITCLANKSPLILVLEDLHWIDATSLETLEFIWDRLSHSSPVLICLVYRSDTKFPIHKMWQKFGHKDYEIVLEQLAKDQHHCLLENLLQNRQISQKFQDLMFEATNGIPLYVEEVVRALIEVRVIRQQENAEWQIIQDIKEMPVPDNLFQIIHSRIDELDLRSPGARRVLWMAAVIGEEFTEKAVLHLFSPTEREKKKEDLLNHINELKRADMIQEFEVEEADHPHWVYRFRHAFVQKVAYESMLTSQRRKYHVQIAHWLEETYRDDLQRHYPMLANHYDKGQCWEKAFEYHQLARLRNADTYAIQDAIFHLRREIEIATNFSVDSYSLGKLYFELGKLLDIIGEFEDAIKCLQRAYGLLDNLPDSDATLTRARVCYQIGRAYERTGGHENLVTALTWRDTGFSLLPKTPTAEAALLHILGGTVYIRQRDNKRAFDEGILALDLVNAVGVKQELASVYRLLSAALRAKGQLAEAMEYCKKGIALDVEMGDLIGLSRDSMNLGVIAFEMNVWALAKEAYRQALEIYEKIGSKYQIAMVCCNLGDLAFHLGEIRQGLKFVRQGRELAISTESKHLVPLALIVSAMLLWRQEKFPKARVNLLKAREKIKAHGVEEFEHSANRWLAQVYLSENDMEQAKVEIEALLSLRPETLGEEFEPLQRLWGQVLTIEGRHDEAIQVLRASLQRLEQEQARYEMGRTLLALTDVLARAEKVTDARANAERAQTIFVELGAKLDMREAKKWLARL